MNAEQLVQEIHAKSNPLAMRELTFTPTERAMLGAMDVILERQRSNRAKLARLDRESHGE